MNELVPTPSDVRTFYFEQIPLRVVMRDGLPWFVAKDVCHAINLSNPSMSVQALDEDERSKFNLGRQGEAVIISESGLYTLVLRCRGAITPGTVPHRFRRFVTGEVLPQVRENGTYGQPVPASSTAALIEALKNPATALEVIGHYAAANIALQEQVEAARPAVDFVEALADSDGLWGLRAAGKALHQGPDKFIKWLRGRGDLYDLDDGPVPKQRLIDRGLFTVVFREFGGKPRPTTKLTGKGVVHYARELGVRPPGPSAQALLPGL